MTVPPGGRNDTGITGEMDSIEAEIDSHDGEGARVVRADFKVIPVNEYLGNNASELNTGFPFVGRQSSLKAFRIIGDPLDDAYLLLTHSRVGYSDHTIKINNRDLPWLDILPSNDATTHLKTIAPGYLVRGVNTFQIFLNGPAFIVWYAVVHWREQEAPAPPPPVQL